MSILKELQTRLPSDSNISEVKFEGSEIVIYTKNPEFFKDSDRSVKSVVRELKKRVEVRPDLSITKDVEKTKEIIEGMAPEGAGIQAIYFEPELGKVVIECEKPGLMIGKGGETFRKIKSETLWLPKIERAPAIDSKIVRAVRNLLHTEIPYRKTFLNRIGQKITTELPADDKKKEWVRFTALGGFRQVGRSCLLVQTPYSNVMMDCGVDVGSSGEDSVPMLKAPEFDMDKLDAVILSHSHLDHCGFIPWLYEKGYKGPLYCTPPTRDLMVLLCLDFVDICQREGKDIWYTKKAVEKTIKHSVVLDYGEVSDITPDIRLTLQPSSHLLGSSLVHLHVGDGLHNILYTSDIKFGPTKLFDPAYTDFPRVETLITESTYGAAKDVQLKRSEAEDRLLRIIRETVNGGGKVLIPSFAVGRGQEIMAILANSDIKCPVYIEGMIWDATAIHTAYPEYLSRYLQKSIFHYGKNPFLAENFRRIVPKERKEVVIESGDPGVVIATSGMLIGGPALEYLKAFAHDPKNTLLFSGYQGEGTLGRRIQKGWKEVPLPSEKGRRQALEIKMKIETAHGLTGHSGRRQLTNYVHRLRGRPERIVVNHGEARKCGELARDMHKMFKAETLAPKNLESVRMK